uniref:RNA-dependent RNA polymerase n=1 Tax=Lutzomyia reovirus 2 TaxID=1670670 RepID=A0A0H4LT89_9REOV|nr:RNA-dependent RNA polymerase [Lutzomyia reovirus 2]
MHLNPDYVEHLTVWRTRLHNDRTALYNYINHRNLIEHVNKQWSGSDACGNVYSERLIIPQELITFQDFKIDDYPLAADGTMFARNHPYDYLTTWNIASFYKQYDKQDIRYQAINDLLLIRQAQSRFSTIWKQMAAVLMAMDDKYECENNPVRIMLAFLLKGYDTFPFYESRGMIIIEEKNINMLSILPTLIYMLMNVGTSMMIGSLTIVESIVAINQYLFCARKAYNDTKLATKSIGREWFQEALHNIGTVKIPVWSQFMTLRGVRLKSTVEHSYIVENIIKPRQEKRKQLSASMQRYIRHILSHSKTQRDVMFYYQATRAMTNDGTYYKTLTELSMDKAVHPKVTQDMAQAPIAIEIDAQTRSILRRKYEYGIGKMIYTYLGNFVSVVAKKASLINYDEGWLRFLSTSSPGQEYDLEGEVLSPMLHAIVKTRVGFEALTSDTYRSYPAMMQQLLSETRLIERQQIDRRQRAIAGLTNRKLFISYILYEVGKIIFDYTTTAAQGKQVGNAYDLNQLLYWSTQQCVLLASTDIAAMDASISPIFKEVFNTFIQDVVARAKIDKYGPFHTEIRDVINVESDTRTMREVTGGELAVAFETANSQTSTTYNSKYFGIIKNAEGTFESGKAYTGGHHTIDLPAIVKSNELRMATQNQHSQLASLEAMGDDKRAVYLGDQDISIKQAISDAECINQCGLATTIELSSNYIVMLQQMVVNGTYWGFADRISLWTREKAKDRLMLSQSAKELNALIYDMSNRVRDQEGLKLIGFYCMFMCISRYTFQVSNAHYKKLTETLQFNGIEVTTYEQTKRLTTLLSITAPIIWMFLPNGGEYPAYPIQRRNGTYTINESIFTPAGPWRRRLLYDICDINHMIDVGQLILDADWLRKYNTSAAVLIIDLKLTEMISEQRKERIPYSELNAIALGLEQYGETGKRERSRQAVAHLARHGYEIPKKLTYGYEIHGKLEDVILSQEATEIEMATISYTTLTKLFKYSVRKYELVKYSTDIYHIFELVETEEILPLLPLAKIINEIQLSYPMSPYSNNWLLLATLGTFNASEDMLKAELAMIQGKYSSFKFDDPVFKFGYRLYKSQKQLLPHFFLATGASSRAQEIMMNAFSEFERSDTQLYQYSLSPRQLYFITHNPHAVVRVVKDINRLQNTSTKALAITQSYIEYLRRISVVTGKSFSFRRLWLDNMPKGK